MTSAISTHHIEQMASVQQDAPGTEGVDPVHLGAPGTGSVDPVHQDAPGTEGVDPTVRHRETRGRELIPRTKLEGKLASVICTCALFHLATGTVMVIMGMLIYGLMGKYSTKHGPVMWWAGLGPFLLGVLGFYAASNRSRRHTYAWGMCSLLLAVTQTAIMGWVGNYTTSHYDVWPLHAHRNQREVCTMRGRTCYCQDYYQGVYSNMELPDVNYIYADGIKWRQTIYDTCSHLGAITSLFWIFHACWGIFIVSAFVACIVAFAGSVCAKHPGGRFERLTPDGDDDDEETMGGDTKRFYDEPLQDGSALTMSTIEVHSRF